MNTELFRQAMLRSGLTLNLHIVADGKLHRFKADGDKARNSWYVLHAGPPAAGAFGCWKRGINETWCDRSGRELTPGERKRIQQRWVEAERQRQHAEAERQTKTRETAAWILNRATT